MFIFSPLQQPGFTSFPCSVNKTLYNQRQEEAYELSPVLCFSSLGPQKPPEALLRYKAAWDPWPGFLEMILSHDKVWDHDFSPCYWKEHWQEAYFLFIFWLWCLQEGFWKTNQYKVSVGGHGVAFAMCLRGNLIKIVDFDFVSQSYLSSKVYSPLYIVFEWVSLPWQLSSYGMDISYHSCEPTKVG